MIDDAHFTHYFKSRSRFASLVGQRKRIWILECAYTTLEGNGEGSCLVAINFMCPIFMIPCKVQTLPMLWRLNWIFGKRGTKAPINPTRSLNSTLKVSRFGFELERETFTKKIKDQLETKHFKHLVKDAFKHVGNLRPWRGLQPLPSSFEVFGQQKICVEKNDKPFNPSPYIR